MEWSCYGLGNSQILVQWLTRVGEGAFLPSIQAGSGAQPACLSLGTWHSLSLGKAAGVWTWLLTSHYCQGSKIAEIRCLYCIMLLHHAQIYMSDICSVVLCAAYVVFFDHGLHKYALCGRMFTHFFSVYQGQLLVHRHLNRLSKRVAAC